ncbi:hypothetical protein TZ53_12685 [Sphingobium sp. YBL2]|nr:hypothetical protein TZ53_12685 [Sphingobium sp. YBL2]
MEACRVIMLSSPMRPAPITARHRQGCGRCQNKAKIAWTAAKFIAPVEDDADGDADGMVRSGPAAPSAGERSRGGDDGSASPSAPIIGVMAAFELSAPASESPPVYWLIRMM